MFKEIPFDKSSVAGKVFVCRGSLSSVTVIYNFDID